MTALTESLNSKTVGFRARGQYNGARLEHLAPGKEIRRRRILGDDDITQEQFDQLLDWLDPDRQKAAERYEWIRKRLIKIFVCRGSSTPEDLADRTINRVARKLPEIRATYVGDPEHYFCGVASFIFRESLRNEKTPTVVPPPKPANPADDDEFDYACLEKCLSRLPGRERDLVVAYYQEEKHAKIDHRKKMAEDLGLGLNALRIRACRIRAGLLKCVELCRSDGGF
jgi:DNA-directed RNA polymerase specialized sigma24 family protein